MFSWTPIYSELGKALPAWRSRQSELIAILQNAKGKGVPMGALEDEDEKGKRFPLEVMDPFTFFAFFNRKIKDEHRMQLLSIIKDNFGLTSPLPDDFEGVPIMNPQKSWFFSYEKKREPDAIDTLWDFAKEIIVQTPEKVSEKLFARTLRIQQVGLANLTMGLFWMRPDNYLAVDNRNRVFLKAYGIELDGEDWPSYLKFLKNVKSQFPSLSWPTLSQRAYQEKSIGQHFWLFQANPTYFDLVAALKAGALRTWQVNQHRKDIHSGDRVVLWLSGSGAGAYGLATVISEVGEIVEDPQETAFHRQAVDPNEPFTGVTLKVDKTFCNAPITKKAFMQDKHTKDAPIGLQGTNFPLTEKQFRAIEALAPQNDPVKPDHEKMLPPALNIILYGPPGTGKTYRLRNHYMDLFTDRQASVSPEEYAFGLIKDLAWWEVVALALLDAQGNKATVAQILMHPLVRAQIKRSANKNPRAMLWAMLQSHTKQDCLNVNYATRNAPLLFSKDTDSVWSIDAQLADVEVPELRKILNTFHNPPEELPIVLRYRFTTFHQSFSYEDFVEGIKPQIEEREDRRLPYEVRDGVFKEICREAKENPGKNYALFIDEINRGNVASIFGELITLLEEDKRLEMPNELTAVLPYSREEFGVPKNLYVIGTMNTADRSVEALDTALRRRFTFEEMRPEPTRITNNLSPKVDLQKILVAINARIEQLLDPDHCIGHYYFMGIKNLHDLRSVFGNKIIPLLREYFYGNPAKVGMVLGDRFVIRKIAKTPFASGSWGADELDEKEVFTFADVSKLKEEDFQTIYAGSGF